MGYLMNSAFLLRGGENKDLKGAYSLVYSDAGFLTEENTLLCLIAYCEYISQEECCYYFNTKAGTLRSYFKRLLEKGLIKGVRLKEVDSRTRILYCITKKGFQTVADKLGEYSSLRYKSKREHSMSIHDYSSGHTFLSCLHCFSRGESEFYFGRELGFSASMRGKKNALFIDGAFIYNGKTVYVEQDMGTERNSVLLQKTVKYHNQDLMNAEKEYLILSYKVPYLKLSSKAFQIKHLSIILENCRVNNCDSLISYYQNLSNIEPSDTLMCDVKETLFELLTLIGALKYADNKYSFNRGRDFTQEDLQRFIDDYNNFRNPYYWREYNRSQLRECNAKRDSLISSYLDNKSAYEEVLNDFYGGFSYMIAPTTLLANCLPSLLSFPVTSAESIMKDYVSGFSLDSYCQCRPLKDNTGALTSLSLRNSFCYSGGTVSFEYASRDIAGVLRAFYFYNHREQYAGHILILIVENEYDAFLFCDKAEGFDMYVMDYHPDFSKGFIGFILKDDFEAGRVHSLFSVYGYDIMNCGKVVSLPDGIRPTPKQIKF